MRFAAPPTGDLRWQAPQPPANVTGIQQATVEPNECYQAPTGTGPTNPLGSNTVSKRDVVQSEDCLFLNVYVPGSLPAAPAPGGLPVIVWIHGGGYISQSASMFNGADLVQDSKNGVIVVVIQYRLGLLGFLPGAAVKANGALNAGLLDQNYALQWVQSHINTFGGDPTKVTIWGESAGAGSVLQHIVANGGNTQPPLFRAVMTSSTFLPSQYNYSDPIPEMLYSEVVSQTSCTSSADTLSCLRNADISVLETINTNINLNGFFGTFVFVPVVDGTFIVERPTVTIGKGQLNGEVLLAVTNTFEGTVFVESNWNANISDYVTTLFPDFGPAQAAGAAQQYGSIGTALEQAIGAMGESIFICPTYYLLQAFGSRSWKGEFAIPPGVHGEDVAYYYTSQSPAYNNAQFITAFSQSFIAVAESLDPNSKFDASNITPLWNAWSANNTEMLFNETEAGAPVVQTTITDSALLQRCAFWNSVSAYTSQ
ncbi:hypothetical protein SERLA73DRAFT_175754 [Serpula lacrymans var. lacrymans S7.3]|uniref:Carboxylic ester hydrolase n=1 Tax=Serpula lacrymans var. lacrymans (strain S7.3) TaxID=936435 RepID=F8PLB4_SERL3|nr:hypothetical protein SERLA73DRAFT_175754 [Serpula lacrymans var. lacrymans S7.3]